MNGSKSVNKNINNLHERALRLMTVCYYHAMYEFQSESTLYSVPECEGTPCSKQVFFNYFTNILNVFSVILPEEFSTQLHVKPPAEDHFSLNQVFESSSQKI